MWQGKKMITDRSIKSKGTNIIVLRWSYNIAIKNRNQIRNNVRLNVVFIEMDELTISYVTKVPICCWKANIWKVKQPQVICDCILFCFLVSFQKEILKEIWELIMQVSVLLVPSDQGLPQLMGQTLPSLVFISKVLLEYDHTYLLPIVYDCFHSHIFMYLG